MRHRLQFQQWVPYPVPQVFAFFANPENLPPLMPGWQKARIDSATLLSPATRPPHHQHTVAAGEGTRMTISFRPLPLSPVRMHWDARIPEFVWDDHFCDEQLQGPFAYWRHCHRVLAETRAGVAGTLVSDDVTYEMKFGPLGEVANLLGGALQMRALFAFRQRQLLKLLAAP
ncbi:MAG TPA: SRPBCC family protein [Acidobacteriaceae bacterium]